MQTPPQMGGRAPPAAGGNSRNQGPPGANLFVRNLPKEFGDPELYNTFAPFGSVLSCRVFIDKNTGLSKCFGFVSYDSPHSAQSAIAGMNGAMIDGRPLHVSVKQSREGGGGSGGGRPY